MIRCTPGEHGISWAKALCSRRPTPPPTRGSDCDLSAAAYARTTDDSPDIVCRIETPERTNAIPEVTGVGRGDVLFIASYHRSAGIGKFGQLDAPEVVGLYRRAERALLGCGGVAGTTRRRTEVWERS